MPLSPFVQQLLDPETRDAIAGPSLGGGRRSAQHVDPAVRESMLSNMLSGVMSGLQWVGESLDKPARTVRGLLYDEHGNFDPGGASLGDLAHLIPFSDTAGLTDHGLFGDNILADKTKVPDATDLRKNWGLTVDTGNTWIDAPANLATDIAIGVAHDPLTFITGPGKALTAKGIKATEAGSRVAQGLSFADEIAQAGASRVLGSSPAAMINEIKAGERGLLGLKIPFMEHPFATFGAGSPLAAKATESAYYNPVSRAVRQIFDPRVREVYDKPSQMAADALHSELMNNASQIIDTNIAVRKRLNELDDTYQHTVKTWLENNPQAANELTGNLPISDMDADAFVRAIAENKTTIGSMRQLADAIGTTAPTPDSLLGSLSHFDELSEAAVKLKDDTFDYYRRMGGDVKALDDEFINHFPRRLSETMRVALGKSKGARAAAEGVWGAVQRNIRDIPGGTFKVNAMTKDPLITATATNPVESLGADLVDQMLARSAQRIEQVYGIQKKPMLDEAGNQLLDKAGDPMFEDVPMEMARYLSKLPKEVLAEGLFSRSLTTDLMDYSLNMMRRAQGLEAVHRMVVETADPEALGPTVAEVFGKTGKADHYRTAAGEWRARKEQGIVNVTDDGVNYFKQQYVKKHGVNPQSVDISELRVPEAFAKSAEKMFHYNSKPEEVHGLLKAYDTMMGTVKHSLYTPWPASHTRNAVSGLWQNAVTAFTNPAAGKKAIGEALKAMGGKGNAEWLHAFKSYGLLSGGLIDDIRAIERGVASEAPGLGSIVTAAKDYLSTPLQLVKNPKDVLAGRKGLFAGGAKIGELVEFVNRYSHFAALKARGWSNAAAARSVKLAHFDYQELTSAERTLFKRLIPFYTFSRRNLPAQLRAIIDEPGGRTAQTIRAVNTAREEAKDKNKYVPSYLSEGLALPLGERQGDTQNFGVSRGLLPVEEAFNRFPFFNGLPDTLHTAENVGAQVTPALGVPLQLMSGRQWWSHRDIGDLYQTPTGNELTNFVIGNSPAARVLSTERSLSDSRKETWQKLLNAFLGGTRVTSVDIPKWMQIEAREVLERTLKPDANIREYGRLYATDISKLDPETVQQLSVLNQIMSETQKLNKMRKAAEKRDR